MYKYELIFRCTLIEDEYLEDFGYLTKRLGEVFDFDNVEFKLISMTAGQYNPDEECEGCPQAEDDL